MSSATLYALLAGIGILPSLIWLTFYLRKDCHPEPKALITKTFLMGIIIAPAVLVFQLLFAELVSQLCGCRLSTRDTGFFLWGAFVEEFFKFAAVWLVALKTADFDEPVDAMIYMITAGLGFAAMENIIYFVRTVQQGMALQFSFNEHLNATLAVWTLRFTGATFLHALASGLVGYFLAMSWFYHQHKCTLIITGLAIATLFHFTFNLFVSLPGDNQQLTALSLSLALLIAMAFLVSVLFDKIRERHAKRVQLV